MRRTGPAGGGGAGRVRGVALAIRQKLAADHPAVTDFRSRLAGSHNNLGNLLVATGRPAEAHGVAGAAQLGTRAIRKKLADDNPTDTALPPIAVFAESLDCELGTGC